MAEVSTVGEEKQLQYSFHLSGVFVQSIPIIVTQKKKIRFYFDIVYALVSIHFEIAADPLKGETSSSFISEQELDF